MDQKGTKFSDYKENGSNKFMLKTNNRAKTDKLARRIQMYALYDKHKT